MSNHIVPSRICFSEGFTCADLQQQIELRDHAFRTIANTVGFCIGDDTGINTLLLEKVLEVIKDLKHERDPESGCESPPREPIAILHEIADSNGRKIVKQDVAENGVARYTVVENPTYALYEKAKRVASDRHELLYKLASKRSLSNYRVLRIDAGSGDYATFRVVERGVVSSPDSAGHSNPLVNVLFDLDGVICNFYSEKASGEVNMQFTGRKRTAPESKAPMSVWEM